MEQKTKALKVSSNVIAVITKIGYIAMTVMIGICAAMLIFMAVTGGKISMFAIGGTNLIIFDEAATTPAEVASICAVLIVVGGIFLAIFLLAHKMFHKISQTGEPFEEKYAKTIRVIGILTAAMPIAAGIAESIVTAFSKTDVPELFTDVPGIVVGAIIFCLSYIIDYGCGLKEKTGAGCEEAIGE